MFSLILQILKVFKYISLCEIEKYICMSSIGTIKHILGAKKTYMMSLALQVITKTSTNALCKLHLCTSFDGELFFVHQNKTDWTQALFHRVVGHCKTDKVVSLSFHRRSKKGNIWFQISAVCKVPSLDSIERRRWFPCNKRLITIIIQ
jgi:hypothetical protein